MSKVVLVTGATSGIGRAAAFEFSKRGARLVLGSRREEVGASLLQELGGVPAVFRRTDVAIEADARALVDLAIERFGRLDVAVNNAALEARGAIDDFDEATYQRVFDTNVKGMFFAMKAQVAAMRRGGGGSIVNVSSTGGSRGMANMSIYVASKHAVEGLSRAAALELAGANIRVNVVAPGPTLTPMLMRVTDGHPEAFASRVPLGRAAAPEEVARAIVWLALDEASFVTGAVLPVNGGLTAA
jgi:NAD(P)-dependent dehydrogenase (short-subunit alcohol dehydrogenase family)